jgi:toxin-antitoxin system PIN domain toxin
MILLDANLLIYASSNKSAHYPAATDWLTSLLSGNEPVALAWMTITAFLRISTHPGLSDPPMTAARAIEVVSSWLEHPIISILEPGPNHWPIFRRLLLETPARGNLVTDAHLAALAIEHDATVYITDGDFRRFRGVRVVNPLS